MAGVPAARRGASTPTATVASQPPPVRQAVPSAGARFAVPDDGRATSAARSGREVGRTPATVGPARIGEAIGVLERLLVVTFVLTGQLAAIGFVVAAKTLARFKQLDDRAFAEYYLLGTLASVSIALGSGLVASAVLRTAG
jgi:hypothetical protein